MPSPPSPPSSLAPNIIACANHALSSLREISKQNIKPTLSGGDLLTERANLLKLSFQNKTSANGSCHLFLTQDKKWIALNLSRDTDWELLPALFKENHIIKNNDSVKNLIEKNNSIDLVSRGRLLGLAISLAEQKKNISKNTSPELSWFKASHKNNIKKITRPKVLDLSSLWAGPLCSHLLQLCGMDIIKIESTHRPDGAKLNSDLGAQQFYAQLNSNKELITINFKSTTGLIQLKQLIKQADIIIEGSRPRALQQLGIDAEKIAQEQGKLWLSITGYGRQESQSNWIAFGDDAAISAGLFNSEHGEPIFMGDALADPLTGLHAALTVYEFWQQGKSALLDINLHTVARYAASYAAH